MNPHAVAQERAARVAGASDLLDVRMLSADCSLVTAAVPERLDIALDLTHETEHEPEAGVLVVRIGFTISITSANQDGDAELVATLRSTWAALYQVVDLGTDEAPDDAFAAFAETSSTLTVFPYAREFFTSMANRLGLPKLVLPTFRLPSPWHPDDESAPATSEEESL